MADTLTPDVCIIGAGSGGLTAAAVCAGFGVPVVLIEKHRMGGDCLNVGCVPSKAILAAAKHAHAIREGRAFGVNAAEPEIDFQRVHDHIHEVIAAIEPNDSVERFEGMGVTVLKGEAAFTAPDCVRVGETDIRARRFVVATGSRPFIPPIPGLAEVPYLTNEVLFDRTERPGHLIIIGGGPIGLEMAQAHRRLGAEVTVIEAADLLGREDREAAAVVEKALIEEGVRLEIRAKVVGVERDGDGVCVTIEDTGGRTGMIAGTHLLVAAGRAVNVEGLGLDKAGIEHSRRGIVVDKGLRTTNRKVFAIGDVAGGLQFTHVAGYHGALIARNILFRVPIKENRTILPRTTYTDPEVASVGLTEEEAKAAHGAIKVFRWPFHDNDRAQAERRVEGFIKLITNKRGRILGAVCAGPKAGEIISLWGLAVSRRMGVRDIAGWVAAYPTLAEVGKRAAVEFYRPGLTNPTLRKIIAFLRRFG
ncbi:MAG: FAD-dependent oxidoreductase [Hyphomicrobiaceae bacterium]|nr:FAD-dependent oxidoreductase [Hyphomicrobiaceae bacterium]